LKGSTGLKLTIDSAEALEDTVRVVGALYNVTLEVSPSAAPVTTGASGQVSTAAVRSWARDNGYAVADRGRVPAEVVTAYRNAQPA
jgi:hypothetical protein